MTFDYDVAIVGSGASGTLLRAHYLRLQPAARMALVGAGPLGHGLAYATRSNQHLLNVPAGKMSALPDQPGHFLDWLRQQLPEADAASFATRRSYGEYLAGLVAPGAAGNAELHQDRVIALRPDAKGFALTLASGTELTARCVVLALGHFPPTDPHPSCGQGGGRYFADAWHSDALHELEPAAPVLLIGTGLSMVDLVFAMREQGHRGPIHALSRHGLRPRAHATFAAFTTTVAAPEGSVLAMLVWLRTQIDQATAAGSDWRAVVDGLRPHTARLWQSLVPAERDRFLRHARPLWEVHRHRLAPALAEQFERLLDSGAVRIHAGRLLDVRADQQGLRVDWRPRYQATRQSMQVARMINCTGTSGDYAASSDPLIVDLRARGLIRPDHLGLGLNSDGEGRLFGRQGGVVAGLYTLGPARRPELWESTAIPELREQAANLAACIRRDQGAASPTDLARHT